MSTCSLVFSPPLEENSQKIQATAAAAVETFLGSNEVVVDKTSHQHHQKQQQKQQKQNIDKTTTNSSSSSSTSSSSTSSLSNSSSQSSTIISSPNPRSLSISNPNYLQMREFIGQLCDQGVGAVESGGLVKERFGDHAPTICTIYKWRKEYRGGKGERQSTLISSLESTPNVNTNNKQQQQSTTEVEPKTTSRANNRKELAGKYCTACNREMSTRHYFEFHMLKVHDVLLGESKTTLEYMERMSLVRRQQLIFRCDACFGGELDYDSFEELRQHKLLEHGQQMRMTDLNNQSMEKTATQQHSTTPKLRPIKIRLSRGTSRRDKSLPPSMGLRRSTRVPKPTSAMVHSLLLAKDSSELSDGALSIQSNHHHLISGGGMRKPPPLLLQGLKREEAREDAAFNDCSKALTGHSLKRRWPSDDPLRGLTVSFADSTVPSTALCEEEAEEKEKEGEGGREAGNRQQQHQKEEENGEKKKRTGKKRGSPKEEGGGAGKGKGGCDQMWQQLNNNNKNGDHQTNQPEPHISTCSNTKKATNSNGLSSQSSLLLSDPTTDPPPVKTFRHEEEEQKGGEEEEEEPFVTILSDGRIELEEGEETKTKGPKGPEEEEEESRRAMSPAVLDAADSMLKLAFASAALASASKMAKASITTTKTHVNLDSNNKNCKDSGGLSESVVLSSAASTESAPTKQRQMQPSPPQSNMNTAADASVACLLPTITSGMELFEATGKEENSSNDVVSLQNVVSTSNGCNNKNNFAVALTESCSPPPPEDSQKTAPTTKTIEKTRPALIGICRDKKAAGSRPKKSVAWEEDKMSKGGKVASILDEHTKSPTTIPQEAGKTVHNDTSNAIFSIAAHEFPTIVPPPVYLPPGQASAMFVPQDDCTWFGHSVAAQLRLMPVQIKELAKMRIQQVIFDCNSTSFASLQQLVQLHSKLTKQTSQNGETTTMAEAATFAEEQNETGMLLANDGGEFPSAGEGIPNDGNAGSNNNNVEIGERDENCEVDVVTVEEQQQQQG